MKKWKFRYAELDKYYGFSSTVTFAYNSRHPSLFIEEMAAPLTPPIVTVPRHSTDCGCCDLLF